MNQIFDNTRYFHFENYQLSEKTCSLHIYREILASDDW